jgi:hypothetical protein
MEEGFEDAITDKSYYHPMQTNEYHSAVGIVDDDIGTMQVDTLSKHIAGENDVVVILLLLPIGIKVIPYGLELPVSIVRRDDKNIIPAYATSKVFYGVNRL